MLRSAGAPHACLHRPPCPPAARLQVLSTAARVGVPMSGENALQRYDQWAFDKICDSAFGQSVMAGRLEVRTPGCRLPGVRLLLPRAWLGVGRYK